MRTPGNNAAILVPLMLAAIAVAPWAGAQALLARDGASSHRIVLRTGATPTEQTAAQELQTYLQRATGASLPIVSEADAGEGPAVYIGPGQRFRDAFPDIDLASLGADGTVLKTDRGNLYLTGGQPRGTLYAVFTFLEDIVGCRWWTSTEEFVPSRPTLEVPALHIVYVPRLRYRELWYRDAFNGVFAAHLRLNGNHQEVPAEYGGHYRILGWCHTFYPLLPPEEYFAQHPEWYSEIDGKRVWEGAQLCLTNDEMRAELTRKALERLRREPDAGFISISQNDWHGRCQCANCLAVEQEEGSPSGPLIRFVNAVAEDIEKEFPDVMVETLAYQYTRQAPRQVRPRSNVLVRLCSIECAFSEPLTAEVNTDFRNDIEAWSAISPQLFVWDYVANFPAYIQPHPNWFVLAPNIRFFVDHKVTGLFEQGDGGSSCGDFVAMRAWALAHLQWDPNRDEQALIDEFLTGYYGPAAEPIRQYMDVMHRALRRNDTALRCYMQRTDDWLTLDDIAQATEAMNRAHEAVAGDQTLSDRVRRARMPLDHVWLVRYYDLKRQANAEGKPFLGPEDPAAACDAFIADAQRFDIGHVREGMPFDAYAPQLRARFRQPGPPPEACRDLDSSRWADIQDAEFNLARPGEWVSLAEDAAASDGMAAVMPGTHGEWAVQCAVGAAVAAMGPVRCYVVARCDAGDGAGDAMTLGIYDPANGRNVALLALPNDAVAGPEYRGIDLGVHDLEPGMYFWVAPAGASKAVYVDRMYVVKE